MLKFSIITISYNSENFIENTILSVLSQSYTNYEYIIIDGGSSDGTIDIIKKYSNKLKYQSESDQGIYDAFNKGIDLSNGEYICFINAGDFYNCNYLEHIAYEIKNFDVIASNIKLVEYGDRIVRPKYPNCNFGKQPFLHPALAVKREMFKKIGNFNKNFKVFGDFEWMMRLLKSNFRYKYLDISDVYFATGGRSSKFLPREYFNSLYINNAHPIYALTCLIRYSLFYILNRFYKFW